MAIGIFILALLLGSVLGPLATQINQRKVTESQKFIEDVRQSLLGFAVAYGYLPCPDKTTTAGAGTPNDGQEDVTSGNCVAQEGNLPWVTLGLPGYDSWGNRWRYRADNSFTNRTTRFSLSTTSSLEICGATSPSCTYLTNVSDGPPAVALSHGPNGFGATNSLTGSANPSPTSADEQENADFDTRFVSRTASDQGTSIGQFDDIVIWLSREILLNRMVAAGRLP